MVYDLLRVIWFFRFYIGRFVNLQHSLQKFCPLWGVKRFQCTLFYRQYFILPPYTIQNFIFLFTLDDSFRFHSSKVHLFFQKYCAVLPRISIFYNVRCRLKLLWKSILQICWLRLLKLLKSYHRGRQTLRIVRFQIVYYFVSLADDLYWFKKWPHLPFPFAILD